ncbi:MAG: hypothetical protein ACOYI8_05240 [Christensenellales bacterium]|jgi:hypothetical protein
MNAYMILCAHEILSLGTAGGARRAFGLTVDEDARGGIACIAWIGFLFASAVLLILYTHLALPAVLFQLLWLLLSLRGRVRVKKPKKGQMRLLLSEAPVRAVCAAAAAGGLYMGDTLSVLALLYSMLALRFDGDRAKTRFLAGAFLGVSALSLLHAPYAAFALSVCAAVALWDGVSPLLVLAGASGLFPAPMRYFHIPLCAMGLFFLRERLYSAYLPVRAYFLKRRLRRKSGGK